jgi:hypothetical protein
MVGNYGYHGQQAGRQAGRLCVRELLEADTSLERKRSPDLMRGSRTDRGGTSSGEEQQEEHLVQRRTTSRETSGDEEERTKPVSKLWKIIQSTIQLLRNPLINAAITIFSLGVGIGLILGDSFRDRTTLSEGSTDAPSGRQRSDRRPPQHAYDGDTTTVNLGLLPPAQ